MVNHDYREIALRSFEPQAELVRERVGDAAHVVARCSTVCPVSVKVGLAISKSNLPVSPVRFEEVAAAEPGGFVNATPSARI